MNPLNVLKERETDFVPEHYTVVPGIKHEYLNTQIVTLNGGFTIT